MSHVCDCGGVFDRPVWHCPRCDHHWLPDMTECPLCRHTRQKGGASTDYVDPLDDPDDDGEPYHCLLSSKGQVLSLIETAKLARDEEIIEKGLQTFVEVGNALLEIRDEKLYRLTHYGFEDYCRDRWGMSRNYAKRLIHAAQVVDNLGNVPMGTFPENERQTRPLATLPPEQQAEAWTKAVETSPNGKPTAKHVAEVVETFKEPAPAESSGDALWDVLERNGDPEADEDEEPEPAPPPDRFGEDWLKWWREMNIFMVSLPRRGGIVNLTARWSRQRRESAIQIFLDLAETAGDCAAMLRKELGPERSEDDGAESE